MGLLLTPHRVDGIRPRDRLPTKGLAGEGGEGIPTRNARALGVQGEDHVDVSIQINILQGRVHRRSLSAGGTEQHCSRVYGGGIKGASGQDGDRDHPFAPRIDAVREAAGLDVDVHLEDSCERHYCLVIESRGLAVVPEIKRQNVWAYLEKAGERRRKSLWRTHVFISATGERAKAGVSPYLYAVEEDSGRVVGMNIDNQRWVTKTRWKGKGRPIQRANTQPTGSTRVETGGTTEYKLSSRDLGIPRDVCNDMRLLPGGPAIYTGLIERVKSSFSTVAANKSYCLSRLGPGGVD